MLYFSIHQHVYPPVPEVLADADDERHDGASGQDQEDPAEVGHAQLVAVFDGLRNNFENV